MSPNHGASIGSTGAGMPAAMGSVGSGVPVSSPVPTSITPPPAPSEKSSPVVDGSVAATSVAVLLSSAGLGSPSGSSSVGTAVQSPKSVTSYQSVHVPLSKPGY